MSSNSIPLQNVVKVNITLQTLFLQQRDFGLPLFVTPEAGPGIDQKERVREYANMTEVADDWNSTTEAYTMAQTAFAQRPAPEAILIGRRFTTNQAGFMQCGALASGVDEADFIAVTDGSIRITIDGATANIDGLDFSADVTFANIATTITAGLTGAVCTYDTATTQFIFTSSSTGAASEVLAIETSTGTVGTDISGSAYLNGRQGVAREVAGLTVGTIEDELDEIIAVNDEWYFLAMTKETRDNADVETIAVWLEALPNGHQFFTTSNNRLILDNTSTSDIASTLQGLSLNRSLVKYSSHPDEYPEVSALARVATVNWTGNNTALTLKFKQLPTITPELGSSSPSFKSGELTQVNDKSANVYSQIGGISMIVSEAVMASGRYQDEVHFADWCANAIETAVFNILFTSATKIPYTEPGLDQLQAGIERSLEQGIRNGGIAPYIDEDNAFKQAYTIERTKVKHIAPSVRASRVYPGFSFVGYLSGAIHAVKPIEGILTIQLQA
jgi:hypothetical protein